MTTSEATQGMVDAPDAPSRAPVDVIIPTRDEARNLPHALASVTGWAHRVYVVDSESTDDTRRIAEAAGATVVVQPWLGHARQKNWALDHLPLDAEWTLFLDADEAVDPTLRDEIIALASRDPTTVLETGFLVDRYFVFLGRRIRHCGYAPSWNLRLFRRGRGRYEDRDVHEHVLVDGPVGRLRGHLRHEDRRGLEVYMAKHNRYSTLEACEILREHDEGTIEARLLGDPLQRRRWIKRHVYPWLPAKWLFRFLFMYVLRLGFLDGLTGLRFCLFMAAYELLISLKIVELRQAGGASSP